MEPWTSLVAAPGQTNTSDPGRGWPSRLHMLPAETLLALNEQGDGLDAAPDGGRRTHSTMSRSRSLRGQKLAAHTSSSSNAFASIKSGV